MVGPGVGTYKAGSLAKDLDLSGIDQVNSNFVGMTSISESLNNISKSPNTRLLYLSNHSSIDRKPKVFERLNAYSNYKNSLNKSRALLSPEED